MALSAPEPTLSQNGVQRPPGSQPALAQDDHASSNRLVRRVFLLGGYAIVYFALARASLVFVIQPEGLASIWPLSGLAVGFLLLFPRSLWPVSIAMTFAMNTLANLAGGNTWAVSAGFAVANTVEPVLAVWLLMRLAANPVTFASPRHLLALVVTAVGSTATAGLLGAALCAASFGADYWHVWFTWWVADGLGILLLVPLLVTWASFGSPLRGISRRRLGEAISLISLLTGVAWFAFASQPDPDALIQRTYLIIPVLVWVALRFPQRGTALALVLLAGIVVTGLSQAVGPFTQSTEIRHHEILSTQAFLAIVSVVTMAIASLWEEQRAVTASLQQSEQILTRAQRLSSLGHWVWHVQEDRLEWSEEMHRIFGIDRGSFTGSLKDVVAQAIHPSDRDAVEQANLSVSRGGRPQPLEYRIVWPDGTVRTVWAEAGELIQNAAGRPAILTGIVQDITARKQAEEALADSERRFRAVVESTLSAIVVHQDGKVVYANPAAIELFGCASAEALVGQILIDRVHPDSRPLALERVQQLASGERAMPNQVERLLRLNGETIEAEVQTARIAFRGKPALCTSIQDITARRTAETALEQQRLHVAQADRLQALGEMASGIAHELNQPLNGIRTFTEGLLIALQRGWAVTPGEQQDTLRDIIAQVDRITEIIDHMRAFARDESTQAPVPFNVSDPAADALKLMGTQLRLRGISVRQEFGVNSPCCLGWPHAIEQVVLNLLSNARDALDERRQRQKAGDGNVPPDWFPELLIHTKVIDDNRSVCLEVGDNGGGVDPEVLYRIFDPYFTTKGVGQGTGLGLAITRSIVDRHRGRIEVNNCPGEGATFRVILPTGSTEQLENNQAPDVAGLQDGEGRSTAATGSGVTA